MNTPARCQKHGHNWLTSHTTHWRTCVQPDCRVLQWFDGKAWQTVTFLVPCRVSMTQQSVWQVKP